MDSRATQFDRQAAPPPPPPPPSLPARTDRTFPRTLVLQVHPGEQRRRRAEEHPRGLCGRGGRREPSAQAHPARHHGHGRGQRDLHRRLLDQGAGGREAGPWRRGRDAACRGPPRRADRVSLHHLMRSREPPNFGPCLWPCMLPAADQHKIMLRPHSHIVVTVIAMLMIAVRAL